MPARAFWVSHRLCYWPATTRVHAPPAYIVVAPSLPREPMGETLQLTATDPPQFPGGFWSHAVSPDGTQL
ncbi:MAG TPA: hypothetical protein VJ794_08995 [Gemmatimonadales bacterium]|nr:hypothetical protein [Gemmatimonadales bacterium]